MSRCRQRDGASERKRHLGSRGIASDLLGCVGGLDSWAAVVRPVRDTRFADDVSPISPSPLLRERKRERTSIEGTDREEEEEWAERMLLPNVVGGRKRNCGEGRREGGAVQERGRPRRRLVVLMRCIASAAASTPARNLRATRNTHSNSDRSGHTPTGGGGGEGEWRRLGILGEEYRGPIEGTAAAAPTAPLLASVLR